jgi:hypothetical protein
MHAWSPNSSEGGRTKFNHHLTVTARMLALHYIYIGNQSIKLVSYFGEVALVLHVKYAIGSVDKPVECVRITPIKSRRLSHMTVS